MPNLVTIPVAAQPAKSSLKSNRSLKTPVKSIKHTSSASFYKPEHTTTHDVQQLVQFFDNNDQIVPPPPDDVKSIKSNKSFSVKSIQAILDRHLDEVSIPSEASKRIPPQSIEYSTPNNSYGIPAIKPRLPATSPKSSFGVYTYGYPEIKPLKVKPIQR